MPLNANKCQQMLIKRVKGTSLDSYQYPNIDLVSNIKILGVTFSSDVKWKLHFNRVTVAASRRLHFLRCLRVLTTKDKLFAVFHASILAVILYASPLFGALPYSIKCATDRIVKRAHRIICGPNCDQSCAYVPDVTALRDRASCKLLLKYEIPDHPLHPLVPRRMARTNPFCLPYCQTSRPKK